MKGYQKGTRLQISIISVLKVIEEAHKEQTRQKTDEIIKEKAELQYYKAVEKLIVQLVIAKLCKFNF